jgi:hypothetical protein
MLLMQDDFRVRVAAIALLPPLAALSVVHGTAGVLLLAYTLLGSAINMITFIPLTRKINIKPLVFAMITALLLPVATPWWAAVVSGFVVGTAVAAPSCARRFNFPFLVASVVAFLSPGDLFTTYTGVSWFHTTPGVFPSDAPAIISVVGLVYLLAKGAGRAAAPFGFVAALGLCSAVSGCFCDALFIPGTPVALAYVLSDPDLHPQSNFSGFVAGAVVGCVATFAGSVWALWLSAALLPGLVSLIWLKGRVRE